MRKKTLIAGGSALLLTIGLLGTGSFALAQTDAQPHDQTIPSATHIENTGRETHSNTEDASPVTWLDTGTTDSRNADTAELNNVDTDQVEELSDSLNETNDTTHESSDQASHAPSEQHTTHDD